MLNSANELNSRHKKLGVFALNVVIRVKLRTITAKKYRLPKAYDPTRFPYIEFYIAYDF